MPPHSQLNRILPQVLVTASRALLLAQWAWREGSVSRLWKAIHTAPVAAMAFDPTSTLLATGRALAGWPGRLEGTRSGAFGHRSPFTSHAFPQVAATGRCASGTSSGTTGHTTFGGRQGSSSESEAAEGGRGGRPGAAQLTCPTPHARSLVAFHPDPARLLLLSSAADTTIRVWSLQDQSCLATMTAHYSAVTSLTFSADGHTMLRSADSPLATREGEGYS